MIRLSAFADEISQDPVEQLDVLAAARHPAHRVPRDPRHQRPRPDRRAARGVPRPARARAGSASARSARRSARSRSPTRSSPPRRFEPAHGPGRLLRDAPDPDLQLLHAPGRRPGDRIATRSCAGWPSSPAAPRTGASPCSREREGDLRRHRRPRARHPRDGRLARLSHAFDPANYLEVGQPIDEAWDLLRPRVTHFHVKDYDAEDAQERPRRRGRRPDPPPDRRRRRRTATTASASSSRTWSSPSSRTASPAPSGSATPPAPSRASSTRRASPTPERRSTRPCRPT